MDYAAEIVIAGHAYASAVAREMEVEDLRPLAKHDAIKRIMATTNELTGKPHSASSAEAIVESDADYKSYLSIKRETVAEKIRARATYDAAVARAALATGALAGV